MDLDTLQSQNSVERAFAEHDWSCTPLGSPEQWPNGLKTALSIALKSRFPIVIFWGPEHVMLYNEAYRPLIGDKHPRALGQRACECFPEIWDAIGPMLRSVLQTGEATYDEDLMLPLVRDGKAGEYYFTFSYSAITDQTGYAGVFCAVQETTAAVVQRRDAEMRARELLELNRAKSAFLSNISHEFRTPLSLMLSPLASALSRTDDEYARESIEMATRNALRLQRLVDSLLTFSRIEAGRLEPRFITIDICDVTAELVSAFESATASAGLTLSYEVLCSAKAAVDRDMWERIVFNLMTNAIKYTHTGSIAVRAESNESDFILSFADTGIGIPEAERERIFERFYRVNAGAGRSAEGAGIGLALTRELVELHRGSIDVHDRPGGGSIFVVRLPLSTAFENVEETSVTRDSVAAEYVAEAAGWLHRTVPMAGAGASHVLVVDDNSDLRGYLARILSEHHRVSVARDGEEALTCIDRDRPDIVVSDVMMPRVDGLELVKRIRASYGSEISVILLSARAGAEAVVEGLSGGADDYVSKPFTASEVLARVDGQLRLQRARRTAELRAAENTIAFREIANALPALIWTTREDGTRDYVNAAWLRYTGTQSVVHWESAVHPDDREAFLSEWHRVLNADGGSFHRDYRLWHEPTRRYRWVTAQARRAYLGSENFWIGTTIDVDERKRRELANEFLARAGTGLNRSLSAHDTFKRLADLAVKHICDYCIFYVVGDGAITRSVWKHRDPAMQAMLDEAVASAPDPSDPVWLVAEVLRNKRPAVWQRGEVMQRSTPRDSRFQKAIERLNLSSVVFAPVQLGSASYGALALARTGEWEPFDEFDVQVIMQLADRAAISLGNADLFEREHRIALSFQNAALPDALPQRHGIDVEAHYVAGQSEARVGGDWYDAEVLPDGRMLLSVGDVSGSGLEAAVIMSMVRYAIRSVAQVYADPATILEAAERATEHRLGEHFITAFVGVIDPVFGRLTYCNAGHVRPVLMHGDALDELGGNGLPIGLATDTRWESTVMQLPPHATLLMFTDGLIEGAGMFLPGEAALHATLRSREFREHQTARRLYEQLLPDGGGDDVAILLARISLPDAAASVVRMPLYIGGPHDASQARDTVCRMISERGLLCGEALENARTIVGELTANIARHAPGNAIAAIDYWGKCPVFHLVDRGTGFRYSNRLPSVFSENGRGLFIASALARRLEVLPDMEGGSHVIAVFDI